MAKLYLGIDPGLTNTALAYFDERGQCWGIEMIKVSITPKLKRALPKKGDRTNYKLRVIFNRMVAFLDRILTELNVAPEDIIVVLEGFWYKPAIKGQNGSRSANNYVFETVAGITATKCALSSRNIFFEEIMPVQVKRIINWIATGKTDVIDKKGLIPCIKNILGESVLQGVLEGYATSVHEHIIDAVATILAHMKKEEYSAYIKIPIKKRNKK